VREPQKRKGLGLPLATPFSLLGRKAAKLDEARLLGMKLQSELAETIRKLAQELPGIRLVLESSDDVIGEPHDDHVACGPRSTSMLDPQVDHAMEVNVGQERTKPPGGGRRCRRDARAL